MQILDDICRAERKAYFSIFNDNFSEGVMQSFGGSWIRSLLSVISKAGSILSKAKISGRGGTLLPPRNVIKFLGATKILD